MEINKFKSKYGHPEWPLSYRKGAPHTSPFGLQVLPAQGRFRIHTATDRGWSPQADYGIWCPFDVDKAEFITEGFEHSFGTILRLYPKDCDFEMRVMHIYPGELDEDFKDKLNKGNDIPRDTFIGKAGDAGLSFGRHTHTELVSLGEKSVLLEELVYEHGNGHKSLEDFTPGYVEQWCDDHNVTSGDYEMQRKLKSIQILNTYLCRRKDYLTQGWRTFYDTKKLFNNL